MTTSEQIDAISGALAKAQGVMKNATLNKVNPHFKNRYADLSAIRDAVIPSLAANGIGLVQTIEPTDIAPVVVTRLVHSSGQWIESRCPLYGIGDMQKMGSAITYARRYSLSAICGISADEDDDGNAAASNGNAKAAEPAKAPEGFDGWLADLESTADEGTVALEAAWKKSQPYYRKHLTDTNKAGWERLKAKASKVKQPEMAHA